MSVKEKRYQYTKNNLYLTEEQRDFYEENGYVVFRKLVDDQLLDECNQRFIDICNGKVQRGMMTLMKDVSLKHKNVSGEFLYYKVQDFVHDEVLYKYISCKPIVNILESIVGPNLTVFHAMMINKPPDSDYDASRHPLHQDMHYFPFRPADSITCSWTAMQHIDEENGCLFVIPGSHKQSLYKHEYPPNVQNKAYHGVLGLDHLPKTNLIMEKGDTVFFHPLLLHGSGPNLTKSFRRAISGHYADNNSHFVDVRGTIQHNIVKEVEDIAKLRKFPRTKYEDVWKLKSRLIQGTPGEFQKFDSHL